ncbi:MAG: hypothetical protein EBZ59_01785 [Planctomycetia bacterium]|nr:hypothetical protein [Planctomycetia bacterium]
MAHNAPHGIAVACMQGRSDQTGETPARPRCESLAGRVSRFVADPVTLAGLRCRRRRLSPAGGGPLPRVPLPRRWLLRGTGGRRDLAAGASLDGRRPRDLELDDAEVGVGILPVVLGGSLPGEDGRQDRHAHDDRDQPERVTERVLRNPEAKTATF